jgi:nitrogen-specific signal transduction histidine kinase
LIDSLTDEQLIKTAHIIKDSALRAADLTAKLLAFSHKGKAHSTPVSIHKIIEGTADILEHSMNKQITIERSLYADPDTTLGDHNQLQNTMLNLAINARDAMTDRRELIFETTVTELDENLFPDLLPGAYLMISITDRGAVSADPVFTWWAWIFGWPSICIGKGARLR